MKITVRKARKNEVPELTALVSELFSIEKDFKDSSEKIKKALGMIMADKSSCAIFTAKAGGKTIGMISCQLTVSTAAGGRSLLIEDLVVKKEFRGLGAGKNLYDAAIKWGIEKKVKRVHLLVDERNRQAITFYRLNKFTESHMRAMYLYL